MKRVLCIPLLLLTLTAFGQEKYRIETDYKTGKTSYYKMDKNSVIVDTLSKAHFRKNSTIEVVIRNVNPFAVEVQPKIEEKAIHANGQGFNFSSLLGGISSMTGSKLALNVEKMPVNSELFSADSKSRGQAASENLTHLNQLTTEVNAMKSSLLSNLVNPNLDKEEIKKELMQIAKIPKDSRLSSPEENFHLYIANFERVIIAEKQDILSDANSISEDLATTETSRGSIVSQNNVIRELKEFVNNLDESATLSLDNLDKIKTLYSLLESSSFDQTFDYILENDVANLELNFVPSKVLNEVPNAVNSSVKRLKLSAKGGFKINTGIALTLNKLNTHDYYIAEDGIIGEDKSDDFVPSLGTMLNFYPMISESFNIGGTFGVSVPLSSDIKGINFLFGPALVLGGNNRVTISGGLAYGPVNKLTQGLKVGEATQLHTIDRHIKTVYDMGYFAGISFSLFDVK